MTQDADVWAKLAAPIAPELIEWRIDSKPTARDGGFVARFVAFISAGTVRKRLDAVVPGEWDLTSDLLPPNPTGEADNLIAFKARIRIRGIARESVGSGDTYKNADTDAFKRAAVRFGIGAALYDSIEAMWIKVNGDGKFAKPLEDPAAVYARKIGAAAPQSVAPPQQTSASVAAPRRDTPPNGSPAVRNDQQAALAGPAPKCPDCGGGMRDERVGKRNPKAPDWRCLTKDCKGVKWPEKDGASKPTGKPASKPLPPQDDPDYIRSLEQGPDGDDDSDLPF